MQQYYELPRDDLNRAMAWRKENDQFLAHFHSSVELAYVEEGELSVVQDGEARRAEAGTLVVNSSYMVHAYATPVHSRVIVATIPLGEAPLLRAALGEAAFARGLVPGNEKMHILLDWMVEYTAADRPQTVGALAAALLQMLAEDIGFAQRPGGGAGDVVRRVLVYIDKNLASPLSVASVARHFGYSASRFSHIFNRHVGCAFLAYVNSCRCRRAQKLLLEGELPLIDVALQCGFSSMRTFYRAFKAFAGATPASYRKGD